MTVALDAARVSICLAMLGYGSYRDVRERRVPNATWYPFAALALALDGWGLVAEGVFEALGYTLLLSPAAYAFMHLSLEEADWDRFFDALSRIPGFSALVYALAIGVAAVGVWLSSAAGSGVLRSIAVSVLAAVLFVVLVALVGTVLGDQVMGGADLKALLVLSVLLPEFPSWVLETGLLGIPAVSVLMNALLIGVVYPFGLFAFNLAKGRRRWFLMFLGTPVNLDEVEPGKTRLLERTEGGGRRGVPGSTKATGESLEEFRRLGRSEVWVPYLIPFVALILGGFVVAVTYGDLYTWILGTLS